MVRSPSWPTVNPAGFGGANGAAIGPDGAVYITNNGGFYWTERDGWEVPIDLETGTNVPPIYDGGWINRVDLASGEVQVLYRECDGHRFTGPNDIVFDSQGGFWFTDLGKNHERTIDKGGVYYAQPDGSTVERKVWPMWTPNGVGLSPDESTLYVAESMTGRLWAFDLPSPGVIAAREREVTAGAVSPTRSATSIRSPSRPTATSSSPRSPMACAWLRPTAPTCTTSRCPTPMTTNVCFGGPDRRTAFVTLSASGQIRRSRVAAPRPRLPSTY